MARHNRRAADTRDRAANAATATLCLLLVLTLDGWQRAVAACALLAAVLTGVMREIRTR